MPTPQDVVECKPLYFILNVLYYPGVRWFGIREQNFVVKMQFRRRRFVRIGALFISINHFK